MYKKWYIDVNFMAKLHQTKTFMLCYTVPQTATITKLYTRKEIFMMKKSISDFNTSFYIQEIEKYYFMCHMHAFQGIITMAEHSPIYLIIMDYVNMCCVIVIIQNEYYLVLRTKSNTNNLVEIYFSLLKELHQILLVIHHRLYHFLYHNHANVMLCFTPFYKMTKNSIMLPKLHTENESLNY